MSTDGPPSEQPPAGTRGRGSTASASWRDDADTQPFASPESGAANSSFDHARRTGSGSAAGHVAGARADADDGARRIEEAGLNNLHTRRQLLYDGWLLFLSPGRAKRARSVNAHFGSTLALADKVRHCESLYERHGLPMLFRITPFSQPPELDRMLDDRGYLAFDRTLVQTAELEHPPEIGGNDDVDLSSPLPEAFVETVGEMRGSPAEQRSAHLERLAQSPLELKPVIARIEGRPVGAGLVSIEGDIAGLFDIVTLTSARRAGVGTRVTAALIAKAWERGARRLFLQVDETNVAALAIYAKFGFATRYTYHYRAPPDQCR